DRERGARVWEGRTPPDLDLIAYRPVVGPNLALERDLAAPERAPCTEAATPRTEKAEELPHGIDAETTRLDRITEEVPLEEPVVQLNVTLRNDAAARTITAEIEYAVHHEQRRKRQACRETRRGIVDQSTVCKPEELRFRERGLRLKLGVGHAAASTKRSR